MYTKRILILQQTDSRFAEGGKELCGMVKVVCESNQTTVTVFVTNAKHGEGQWWILLSFGGEEFAHCLQTFNNDVFVLPRQNDSDISCLLVKNEGNLCFEAAQAQHGLKNHCGNLRRQMQQLVCAETPYEQFVASTQNFYGEMDVDKLCAQANTRYRSVQDYSAAFERYYASGGESDYYNSVQKEICKVFLQFPPYYPLIRQYKNSFFVRIDFPSSENFFVLGVLEKDGIVRYICYGLPAQKGDFHDKDFVFVESEPINFWMLFQDAGTGQISAFKEQPRNLK